MPIKQFSEGAARKGVVYFGDKLADNEKTVFTTRGYQVFHSSELDSGDPSKLAAVDSVIFVQSAQKPTAIVRELKRYATILLEQDCRVYVRVASNEQLQQQGRTIIVNTIADLRLPAANLRREERDQLAIEFREREGIRYAPYIYVCDVALQWDDIAKLINDNPAGKAPNPNLKILDHHGGALNLSREREILIRRAFEDCKTVRLHQMDDGLSQVKAYRLYAELSEGLLGPSPSAYFVKIGARQKITEEYDKYQGVALTYIPFHLGPRLHLDRCALGAHEGIIVGSFVEDAELLRDCANAGRATAAIGNLLNRTLRPWHNRSWIDPRSIAEFLLPLFPTEVPDHRQSLIRQYGATRTLDELRTMFQSCTSSPVRIGFIHGDLHTTNVLVRSDDAIIIDFEKVENNKPLVYDLASLEGSLFIDGFIGDKRSVDVCLASVKSLYETGAVIDWMEACHPSDPSWWFYQCVRQIRIHADHLECKPSQYALALVVSLLKKSCNPEPFKERRAELRAAAYAIAETILASLSQRNNASEKK